MKLRHATRMECMEPEHFDSELYQRWLRDTSEPPAQLPRMDRGAGQPRR